MKLPPVQEKNVLITGCSSGIGAATAHVLRERGWHVLPTARKQEDLDRLKSEGFRPIQLDVSDQQSVKQAASEALKIFKGKMGGLVNNAGFGQAGAVEDLTPDVLRYQFEVNVFGLQDLTNQMIPTFRKQGWGRIVNISSVLGKICIPFYGSYCASKYAVEALSDSMRIELMGSGIGVMVVEPGPIQSNFRQTAADRAVETLTQESTVFGGYYQKEIERRIQQQKKPNSFTKPPEAVAKKIVHALESSSPRRRYPVTLPAYVGIWAGRFMPQAITDALQRPKIPTLGRKS